MTSDAPTHVGVKRFILLIGPNGVLRYEVPEKRYCLCFDTRDLEDEYHFICFCPCYVVIRRQYLHKDLYQNQSMFKFINYLNSWNKVELLKLSMFVKDALAIRNTILNVHR